MQLFFKHDGLRLAYYIDDFTDPWRKPQILLLLHAAMGSAQRFYAWVPRLCRQYRVIRLDLRGHGASDVPAENAELTLDQLVADVIALLDHLECAHVHVVGNSAGGYVAQQLAMHYPERVSMLALYGSTPGLKHSQAVAWIPQVQKKGLRNFFAETIADRFPADLIGSGLVEWFLDELGKNDPTFVAKFVLHMASHDWSDQLHRIACPTLVVVPGAEPVGSVDNYRPMLECIPRCEMLIYDGARHNICDYLPYRCVTDLLSFLERHGDGS